mgnify:CR=1 FL=1
MHILQPKHSKLKPEEVENLLKEWNISLVQLPKIDKKDPMVSEDCKEGDVIKIDRSWGEKTAAYYRVVV